MYGVFMSCGELLINRLLINITFFKDILGLINDSDLLILIIFLFLCGLARLAWLWKAPMLYFSVRLKEKLLATKLKLLLL